MPNESRQTRQVTFRDLINDYRDRHQNDGSLEDQVAVLSAHRWVGTQPIEPNLRQSDIKEIVDEMGIDLDCNLEASVRNTDADPAIDSFVPDDQPDWFIIRQRDDEFVMGDDFPPAVHDECERVISHIDAMDTGIAGDDAAVADGAPPTNDDGETLREVVTNELGIDPNELEDHLRGGDAGARQSKLEEVVEIVEESEFDKPDSYDTIDFIPSARRYYFTEWALDEYDLA